MVRIKGQHEIIALGNLLYPETFEKLRQEYIRLLPAGAFLPYYQGMGLAEAEKDPFYGVAATLVRHSYQVIAPDVILYPSVFEGWMEQGIVPLPKTGIPNSFNAAIIYDFIPFIFAERFLQNNSSYKDFYTNRLKSLKKFDLLLAISESTRQDAIKILNIKPAKVVNISAAANPRFKENGLYNGPN